MSTLMSTGMILMANIFRAGGEITRGLLNATIRIGKIIANMLYFQDELVEIVIRNVTDMSDTNIWGSISIEGGQVVGDHLWGMALKVYESLAVIGFGLFLVYWLINVIEKSNQDRLNGNELVRTGLQLIIGTVLIMYGPNLLYGLTGFSQLSIDVVADSTDEYYKETDSGQGNGGTIHSTGNLYLDDALEWIGFRNPGSDVDSEKNCDLCFIAAYRKNMEMPTVENSDDLDDYVEKVKDAVEEGTYDLYHPEHGYVEYAGIKPHWEKPSAWKHYNIGSSMGMLVSAVIVLVIQGILFLGMFVILMIVGSIALSRSIQILIYTMFAPLAFADTFHQGFINSKSWRYIQKFIALCIQAGIIFAAIRFAPLVARNIGDATGKLINLGSFIKMIIMSAFTIMGYLTALGLAQKASQISSDIIGA